MRRAAWLLSALVALPVVLVAAPGDAQAQVYKYTKGDGTVIYTDKLSDLPPQRRAHYAKLEEEAAERRRAQENMLGKDEVARREAEAEKKRLADAKLAAEERAKRMAEIDALLQDIDRRQAERDKKRGYWQERLKKANETLAEKLNEFRKTQEAYNAIAIKPAFTLFPGEAEQMEKLKAALVKLEAEVDAAIQERWVNLPEDARKAGVPPGWLR
ncbi:MAG: DUF4124 domain-containing protein [Deltaproteobacteria bacterium]|nr:DUF4124 domain-containing protein [Deltaproteobacteria bacterium]